jgi:hypothetical protein
MGFRGVFRRAATCVAALAALAAVGCGRPGPNDASSLTKMAPPVAAAAAVIETPAPEPLPEVSYEAGWKSFGVGRCAYLPPKDEFIGADGSVDIVFELHAGQMAQRDLVASGVRGVFVACGYGIGSGGYSKAFEDPTRFGRIITKLTRTIGAAAHRRDVHVGRLALASWSAGFAAVNRILASPEWYAATDTVVLLDSLHARYGGSHEHVDVRTLQRFVHFARDAAAGTKTMVITHSSIVPPGYASTTEATAALLAEAGVHPTPVAADDEPEPAFKNAGMHTPTLRVDQGGLHVRGFRGAGPHDHFDHLHLIGVVLRTWLVPHWYTPASERP